MARSSRVVKSWPSRHLLRSASSNNVQFVTLSRARLMLWDMARRRPRSFSPPGKAGAAGDAGVAELVAPPGAFKAPGALGRPGAFVWLGAPVPLEPMLEWAM